jgi:hypothetical protein
MKKDQKGLFFVKVVFTSGKALGQGHYQIRALVKPSLHGFCVGVSQAQAQFPSPKGFTLHRHLGGGENSGLVSRFAQAPLDAYEPILLSSWLISFRFELFAPECG